MKLGRALLIFLFIQLCVLTWAMVEEFFYHLGSLCSIFAQHQITRGGSKKVKVSIYDMTQLWESTLVRWWCPGVPVGLNWQSQAQAIIHYTRPALKGFEPLSLITTWSTLNQGESTGCDLKIEPSTICLIFTILVSFSKDNALFASKAKINVFWKKFERSGPEGASGVRKFFKKHCF